MKRTVYAAGNGTRFIGSKNEDRVQFDIAYLFNSERAALDAIKRAKEHRQRLIDLVEYAKKQGTFSDYVVPTKREFAKQVAEEENEIDRLDVSDYKAIPCTVLVG